MFAVYFVVVLALFGSEFGPTAEATESAQCAYLRQGALTMIRTSNSYTTACKCGTTISKVEVVNATTGKTESRETCTGCTTSHVPIQESAFCTNSQTSGSCFCKAMCSGVNVYTCSCTAAVPAAAVIPDTTVPPVNWMDY